MERGPMALFGGIVMVGLGPALWLGVQFAQAAQPTGVRPPIVAEYGTDAQSPTSTGSGSTSGERIGSDPAPGNPVVRPAGPPGRGGAGGVQSIRETGTPSASPSRSASASPSVSVSVSPKATSTGSPSAVPTRAAEPTAEVDVVLSPTAEPAQVGQFLSSSGEPGAGDGT